MIGRNCNFFFDQTGTDVYSCDKDGKFQVLSEDYGTFEGVIKIKIPKKEGKVQKQIAIINSLEEIVGCSLEEETGEINWHACRAEDSWEKDSWIQQTDQAETMPDYLTAYPWLCYPSSKPDKRELLVFNLAQSQEAPYRFDLGKNLQFFKFIENTENQIDFVAKNWQGGFDHCRIACEHRYQLVNHGWSLEVMYNDLRDLSREMYSIEQISSIKANRTLEYSPVNGYVAYVLQTKTDIKFYEQWQNMEYTVVRKKHTISTKEAGQTIRLQRGFNDIFYYVETDQASATICQF